MSCEDDEAILKYLDSLDKDSRAIKKELFELCWYMRGGLTYIDALELGQEERNIMSEISKEHLETTTKSNLPFF